MERVKTPGSSALVLGASHATNHPAWEVSVTRFVGELERQHLGHNIDLIVTLDDAISEKVSALFMEHEGTMSHFLGLSETIAARGLLLAAMDGIKGNVGIEGDMVWHEAETGAAEADHGLAHAEQLARPRQVLDARDGWLGTQRGNMRPRAGVEDASWRGLEASQPAPGTGGNRQDAEAQHTGHAMNEAFWRARISNAFGQALGEARPDFDLAQGRHAAGRRALAVIDVSDDWLAADR